MALDGCRGARTIRSKLYYNIGLAFTKGGRYREATEELIVDDNVVDDIVALAS